MEGNTVCAFALIAVRAPGFSIFCPLAGCGRAGFLTGCVGGVSTTEDNAACTSLSIAEDGKRAVTAGCGRLSLNNAAAEGSGVLAASGGCSAAGVDCGLVVGDSAETKSGAVPCRGGPPETRSEASETSDGRSGTMACRDEAAGTSAERMAVASEGSLLAAS